MVNWHNFEQLSGSQTQNFEILCRSLIRLHFGRYGRVAALANQPGVEFHLKLDTECSLGESGRWYGWQCKWFDLPRGRALGTARRNQISRSLAITRNALPELTDWILWTRFPLTKADQRWFFSLAGTMRLNLWTESEIETYLSGDAEILRATYFGELILTPQTLSDLHLASTARIKWRWLRDAHQPVNAERKLRRILGEAESWDEMLAVSSRLVSSIKIINKGMPALSESLSSRTLQFINFAKNLSTALREIHFSLINGDLDLLRQRLDSALPALEQETISVPRHLRAIRISIALEATNTLADIQLGIRLFNEVKNLLGVRIIGVLADAGGGKTQLAAQLTDALTDRPAGLLLHGLELQAGQNLDDLARKICIHGRPVPSMEALIAAIDAAGKRSRRRLPVVIDGLNEAEDPRNWKGPLAALTPLLDRYANVLLVCTLRTGARRLMEQQWNGQTVENSETRSTFADQALPDEVERLEIPDFGSDEASAIRRYFRYFKINPGEAELPFELLSHPLTLRLFCEVTNPRRIQEVGIEAMPGSLTALFERYLELAIERIAELAPRTQRYFAQDIRSVLNLLGLNLWEQKTRELSEHDFRRTIGDETRTWNESIIHFLEQEGVILRIPGVNPGNLNIIPVYDALGGYLIANALLAKFGQDGLAPWLKDSETLAAFNDSSASCHPLALDAFRSLVGLVPRRLLRQQLWTLLDEPLRSIALRMATYLEGEYLDATTVTAIANLVRNPNPGSANLFRRLYQTRSAVAHPLNAEFFDQVLRSMSVAERDLHWTEWVRSKHEDIQKSLSGIEEQWINNLAVRSASNRLRAKWIMWLLTSTSHELRDRTTRTLYWFGRGDPKNLFDQTCKAVNINDPYVFERMLAVSYGVALAMHSDSNYNALDKCFSEFARNIYELMFKENAPHCTTHILTREYGKRLLQLAALRNKKLFSKDEIKHFEPPYKSHSSMDWNSINAKTGDDDHEPRSPFRMDFENYTLGRLVSSRHNYDYENPDYRKVRTQVLWRVAQLGWNAELFDGLDRRIESDNNFYRPRNDDLRKIDRYGKKYSWIAYFELAGWLQDQAKLERHNDYDRPWDVDIDPSFPSPPPELKIINQNQLGDPGIKLDRWISNGATPNVMPYIRQSAINAEKGPWVALDGFFCRQDESLGRRLFCFVRSFFVKKSDVGELVKYLRRQSLAGRWLPENPRVIYTFAGEIPWCDTFPENGSIKMSFVTKKWKVKVKRKRPAYFLDGKALDSSNVLRMLRLRLFGDPPAGHEDSVGFSMADLARIKTCMTFEEHDEVRESLRKFNVLIPICDFGWEGRNLNDISVSSTTLAKEIAKDLKLTCKPQTLDSTTASGERVTFNTRHGSDGYHNSEKFFFIRENWLQDILKKRGLALVWAIWGERELSSKLVDKKLRDPNSLGQSSQVFQAIHQYKA